ncbi:MAG: hypothetical protein JST81_13970 [Bacteroidetes bacterium]|nr:hypothetical protein [Bacteroidota bacterium]
MIFFMIVAAVLLFGFIVMGLWNAILPQVIAGVKIISYPQALGILLLSKILFGGFRGGCGGRRRGRFMEMQQKMAAMTPEEREKFKAEWKSRCGYRWKKDPSAGTNAMAE